SGRTMQWRSALGTSLLTVVSLLFAAIILEVGARIVLPPAPGPSDLYMQDSQYIFTLRPNSKGEFTLRDDNGKFISVEAKTSSQGVRDREIGPKTADEFRIVMIGDSFTMGHGLEPQYNIPH